MALLPSSALTFLNIAYFKAPVSPISFNQATYSWVQAVQGWAAAASDPATFNSLTNGNPPTYGYLISPSTGNAEQYVQEVYQNLFGSSPSAANLTYWKNWLTQFGNNTYIGKDGTNYGIANYKALVVAVYEYATADELAALTNRQTVSQYFSTSMQNNPSGSVPSFNTAQYNAGWASISTVTKDPATVTTAKASVDQFVATTGSVGNSFVLTPDVDIKSGNQFLAPPVAGQAGGVLNTFTSGDALTGTGTNPTLTILWQQTLTPITTVQPNLLKNISTLNATLVGNKLNVLSTFVTGLKTVNINDTSGNLTMTNLQSALETIAISRSFTGADHTFTIADAALAGTEDALAIKLNQVVFVPVVADNTELAVSNLSGTGGYEKVSVNSAGFANTIEMAGVLGLKSLTITGDKALTLAGVTSLDDTVTLVDASTFNADLTVTKVTPTGNLEFKGGLKADTFTLDAAAGNHKLSGGTGKDNLTVGGNNTVEVSGGDDDDRITFTNGFTTTDVIAGGAGVNTLAFATPANAEAITAENANVTGIQTLALTTPGTGNATLRADLFGNDVNTVTLQNGTVAAGAYTIRYNTGQNTLNIWGTPLASETGVLSLATNGTATTDKVTVNLVGRPALVSNDITIGGIKLNPVDGTTKLFTESLVINSSDADMVHTIGAGGITFNEEPGVDEKVTVTGNSGLTVGGAIIADKVDASALTGATGLTMTVAMGNLANGATVLGSLTGKNTLQGSVFNDKITAGGAGDTLSGNAGSDTLTGGAGVDTFVQTAGATLTAGKGFTTATLTNGEIAQLTQPLAPAPTNPLSGPDIIQSFEVTDRFQTGVAANYTLLTAGDAIAAGANFGIRGTYTAAGTGAGTFTVNIAAGNDLLVFTATGAGLNVAGNLGTNLSILQGGGALALTAANFVV
ncbi:MAG: calcium-binding protein [Microcystis aeruginosa Ma_QC_Ch_20071001_S25]|uniref:Calcium-binding protein n=1 Tax=Microcystis aeruginosa Ma_QC_Ch_20071001_S25D TaxID=2486250 RepID=A0A552G7K1_MICAE|nr:MAG: calcium-binding protein [Microcystis aeruginosa Ma_QC_Ch_20071001_S25]TRU54887.1 MAG: calcium-binding protein [Microcystis aeruginosa Ma_QC_Ch_20071001_S25D]TRU57194.1 MAG: calcium-binding protein [Microcystis aeruginosa Ma_QC_Ch_20071001_M135]